MPKAKFNISLLVFYFTHRFVRFLSLINLNVFTGSGKYRR